MLNIEVTAVSNHVTKRRERTHKLYVIQGLSREETVERVVTEFDTAQATVHEDLRAMSNWIADLVQTDPTGESRIQELREARSRLYYYVIDARENGDADLEREIVRSIISSITTDIKLCQSLGLTDDAGGQIDLPEGVNADDPITGLAERDPAVLSASR
jgi:hypothetical protein